MKKRLLEITILVMLAVVIVLIFENRYRSEHLDDKSDLAVLPAYIPEMEYGIVVDSLFIVRDKIKKNQFLADILLKYGMSYSDIDLAVKRARPMFDVRCIRHGHKYSVLCKNDSVKKVQYFVYEESPISFIVFDFRDSIHIHKGKKEIKIKVSQSRGVIKSSLWNALLESNSDPNLANELSEIFAWTIDFFGVQKNDAFKVVFEELYIEGEKVGLGKILAAQFKHYGENHYAFYFVQNDQGDYFDEKGNSLRRAFLKAPLKFKRISSKFSHSRLHPVLKCRRPHLGVDYAAAVGTPIHTIGDGVVIRIYRTKEGGKQIKIKHNGTYTTGYLHLSAYAKGIRTGVKVKQGDVIAYVGKTGLVTGPHLDFRFYKNGKAIDPLKVKSPAVNPVDSLYYDEFIILKDSMSKYLNRMPIKINY
jgi:murein DD-endopeptidase MepM/ murein hydrolase activator NlpD